MQQRYLKKFIARYGSVAVLCALGLSGLILTGCGGGNGNGSATTVPQGNAGVRAIAIAADQSIASGRAFPLAAVLDTAPIGSVFTRPIQAYSKSVHTRAAGTLVFDPSDGLYKTYTIVGNTQSVAYYTDAAGTQSAGTASMMIVGATSFNTAYTTYPVTVNFTANVTAGTLPFKGSGTVVFTDSSGANSLTGKFTLPLNNVVVSGKLSLDSSSNVSGSVDIVESGATLHVTNLSGNLSSDVTGTITSDPYGWKGTGTFNLQTGKFSITLNTGSGTATAASDASGSLTLHFADGTSQTITNPLTSTLAGVDTGTGSGSGGGNNNGGTGSGGSVAYNAPVALVYPPGAIGELHALTITGANIAIGQTKAADGNIVSVAWSGPNNPVILAPVPKTKDISTLAMSGNTTLIVGGSGIAYNVLKPAIWSGAGYTPQALPIGAFNTGLATSINAGGQIVGVGDSGGSSMHSLSIQKETYNDPQALYWSNTTAAPAILTPLVAGGNAAAIGINNNGQIVGYAFNAAGVSVPVYWSSPTATPIALTAPSGSTSMTVAGIDNQGNIAGTSIVVTDPLFDQTTPLLWSSPTAAPTALPLPAGATLGNIQGISGNGIIVGSVVIGTNVIHATVWKNQQIEDLNDTLPTNSPVVLIVGQSVNDQGQILVAGIGLNTSDNGEFFTLTPK